MLNFIFKRQSENCPVMKRIRYNYSFPVLQQKQSAREWYGNHLFQVGAVDLEKQMCHFQEKKGLLKIMLQSTGENKMPWNFRMVLEINFEQLLKPGKSANIGEWPLPEPEIESVISQKHTKERNSDGSKLNIILLTTPEKALVTQLWVIQL